MPGVRKLRDNGSGAGGGWVQWLVCQDLVAQQGITCIKHHLESDATITQKNQQREKKVPQGLMGKGLHEG